MSEFKSVMEANDAGNAASQLPVLSAGQATAILDHAPVAVYVSSVDSKELLYINRLAQKLFFTAPCQPGTTCYQVAGFEQPCPFCTADKMSGASLLVRRFKHPSDHRIYQLSGQLIDWDGRQAHIEYISDITEVQEQEDKTNALSRELQETFGSIPCGLCVYKVVGERINPIFHNPVFYQIIGYSKEHILSVERQHDYLGVHPQDKPLLQEKIKEMLHTGIHLHHVFRIWNDIEQTYHWIQLEGSLKVREDGDRLLYGIFSDVSEEHRLEMELRDACEKMQDIIKAIPGGVAIYKITDIFETTYFSEGLPELTGYTQEEYRELIRKDAAELIYQEDRAMVTARILEVIENHQVSTFEFRKQHKDGSVVWVRVRVRWTGEEDGCPLIHCVFHNITDTKEAQLEMDHLVNSIPGGIASYRIEKGRFIPTFYSDGVLALSGHTREEFQDLIKEDALNIIDDKDRDRVLAAARIAVESGQVLDVSYRMRHKNGNLIWIHLNGRRMGPIAETMRFYAVFTGMSAEAQPFQNIANETADGIYVIDRENLDLLYANESKELFHVSMDCVGQKCYTAIYGQKDPCEFCTLQMSEPDGTPYEMELGNTGRFYSTSFRETNWNGIPAYVKFVRDVTDEVLVRQEKERLEQYFENMVKYLPDGVAVIRYENDGTMVPEFLSDGFAAMMGMTLDEAWQRYGHNAMAGVHPEDRQLLEAHLTDFINGTDTHYEIVYRLKKGGGYIWVKNSISFIRGSNGGQGRIYANYHDFTREREEKEQLRRQYSELIIQHYRTPGPNVLILGHCNITRNRILEIDDQTGADLLTAFGTDREMFFTGVAGLVADEKERQTFLDNYLNEPSLAAYQNGKTEVIQKYFIRLPEEGYGRYAEFRVNLVQEPDTGDITGILTVSDVTETMVADRILRQLSNVSYDYVIDLDLVRDSFTVLTGSQMASDIPQQGRYSSRIAFMRKEAVVPRDKELYTKAMDPDRMYRRLEKEGTYTFSFSMLDQNGDVRTKNMVISAVDLRIGRVCVVRTDITDSVREQQGLLNVVAYTFELLVFIKTDVKSLTMYTRQTVLENLLPVVLEDYDDASLERLAVLCGLEGGRKETEEQFCLRNILERLEQKPSGYDFVLPFHTEKGVLYKQINVLWGDETHKTVCMVRADVTDMLAAEYRTKEALEKALEQAEEASRAKGDFLSSMSHDIRTPMNAIMGMTELAFAHLDDHKRLEDCLQKISFSSRHLLSLINDILDMSKIESAKIVLNREKLVLPELIMQLTDMLSPQAESAGVILHVVLGKIRHPHFYGDSLRLNQILINILGNAIKFTNAGGKVEICVKEMADTSAPGNVRYCFTVSDTGIGMSEDFLAHIFEPFTRSRTAQYVEGTGLGLSITKGLIDLMNGEISVKSEIARGSVFVVELEFEIDPDGEKTVPDKRAGMSAADEKPLEGLVFLVAEDNAINSEIICELLQMYGGASVVKTDGAQAVQAFGEAAPGTYDAILMDVQMPEMNGYEATRAIRAMDRKDAGTIPVIAMTANAFAEDIQAAMEAGMTAHVAKPIDIQVLLDTIDRVLHEAAGQR